MKTKTYGISFLVASHLQLNIFSCKWLVTKKLIPFVLAFILILKVYKQGVLFYIFIFKNMGIWDESIKMT